MKAIIFDLNKTLIHENSWYELNMNLGVTEEQDAHLMELGQKGEITDQQGQDMLLKIYKEKGQHSKKHIESILSQYTYMYYAKEIISYAKSKGYTPILISGGIDILVAKIAKELGIQHWSANNTFIFDDKGYLDEIIAEDNDNYAKYNQVLIMSKQLGFNVKEAICVGDGDNEKDIFELTEHGITFKGSKLENIAWKLIDTLEDIKKYI